MAYGCNIGKDKIAGVSRNINEYELENTINWYFTEENVDAANDKILTLENRLILPDKLKKNPNITHTSSDGQKYSVEIETLNADYSFKYFGKGKGVSAYNFIDDRHFLFHSTVISSSDGAYDKSETVMSLSKDIVPTVTRKTKTQNIDLEIMDVIEAEHGRASSVAKPWAEYEVIGIQKDMNKAEVQLSMRWRQDIDAPTDLEAIAYRVAES